MDIAGVIMSQLNRGKKFLGGERGDGLGAGDNPRHPSSPHGSENQVF